MLGHFAPFRFNLAHLAQCFSGPFLKNQVGVQCEEHFSFYAIHWHAKTFRIDNNGFPVAMKFEIGHVFDAADSLAVPPHFRLKQIPGLAAEICNLPRALPCR